MPMVSSGHPRGCWPQLCHVSLPRWLGGVELPPLVHPVHGAAALHLEVELIGVAIQGLLFQTLPGFVRAHTGIRVQVQGSGSGFEVQGLRFRVCGPGFEDWGSASPSIL